MWWMFLLVSSWERISIGKRVRLPRCPNVISEGFYVMSGSVYFMWGCQEATKEHLGKLLGAIVKGGMCYKPNFDSGGIRGSVGQWSGDDSRSKKTWKAGDIGQEGVGRVGTLANKVRGGWGHWSGRGGEGRRVEGKGSPGIDYIEEWNVWCNNWTGFPLAIYFGWTDIHSHSSGITSYHSGSSGSLVFWLGRLYRPYVCVCTWMRYTHV